MLWDDKDTKFCASSEGHHTLMANVVPGKTNELVYYPIKILETSFFYNIIMSVIVLHCLDGGMGGYITIIVS